MDNMEIHYSGDWAGLYVDGLLVQVGDVYVAEAMALGLAGVKTVHDPAFMRGQKHRDGVARTLDEVDTYRQLRDDRNARAAALDAQAAQLAAQAAQLRTVPGDR